MTSIYMNSELFTKFNGREIPTYNSNTKYERIGALLMRYVNIYAWKFKSCETKTCSK